jgi:hypothetical protein
MPVCRSAWEDSGVEKPQFPKITLESVTPPKIRFLIRYQCTTLCHPKNCWTAVALNPASGAPCGGAERHRGSDKGANFSHVTIVASFPRTVRKRTRRRKSARTANTLALRRAMRLHIDATLVMSFDQSGVVGRHASHPELRVVSPR